MIKKTTHERRVYESVDDNSLFKVIFQKNNEKNKSFNKGLSQMKFLNLFNPLMIKKIPMSAASMSW